MSEPRKPRFTLKERVAVLTEALRLIKSPDSWVKGTWKCPITKVRIGKREGAEYRVTAEIVRDKHGRPLFAYCLEGAINQGIVNILGPQRAEKLGAVGIDFKDRPIIEKNGEGDSWLCVSNSAATHLISVAEMAAAEGLIPDGAGYDANGFNDADKTTHEQVIALLKKKRKALKAKIKAKQA